MQCKRIIASVAIFWWIAAPAVLAQDFLKQLEETILKRQEAAKSSVPNPKDGKTQGDAEPLPAPTSASRREGAADQEGASKSGGTLFLSPAAGSAQVEVLPTMRPQEIVSNSPTAGGRPDMLPRPSTGGGYLGMTVESSPASGPGLAVTEVKEDGPAWKAGFRQGDRLMAVDLVSVSTVEDLAVQLAHYNAGEPVRFQVDRNGRSVALTAILMDRDLANRVQGLPGPSRPSRVPLTGTPPRPRVESPRDRTERQVGRLAEVGQPSFGVSVSDMSEGFRRQFGISAFRGASVTAVAENSPAYEAGLRPGDCIVAIEGLPVYDAAAVVRSLSVIVPGDFIEFSYYRGSILKHGSAEIRQSSTAPEDAWGTLPVTQEMLTPDYVEALHAELDRVSSELRKANERLQRMDDRLRVLEGRP